MTDGHLPVADDGLMHATMATLTAYARNRFQTTVLSQNISGTSAVIIGMLTM